MKTIIDFLMGPWGAILSKGLIILTLVASVWVAWNQHNNYIARNQQIKDQNAQVIQVIKNQQILDGKLADIQKKNNDILVKLDAKNQKVVEVHDKVTKYITSPEGQKSNRPTSDVIRNTIGMLQDD